MPRGSGRRRSAEEWAQIIKDFRSSDLSRAAFCRRERVSTSSLDRWEAKLGSTAEDSFVELPVPGELGDERVESESGIALEVELPSGVVLRLRG